ncbi:MAG: class IV adenylate cyclase [Planctomycetes bacterium]|nr:class IV adenylate cyclase [Planctomycetota bacterium]
MSPVGPPFSAASAPLRRNIELKARLCSLEQARIVAERLATERIGSFSQTDTYFLCATGRLKLREMDGRGAELIAYSRPDQPGPKASDYHLVQIAQPQALKRALSAALGVRAVVRKRREVFLHHNVRIHLDQVERLGSFLEFEAVLDVADSDASGQHQVEKLLQAFSIVASDLIDKSYVDLIEA